MTDTPRPYSLRDLPTPAKLVVTCYLIGVGLGYFSALVQLHLQHSSRNGEAMPGLGDVVEIFAGWKKATDEDRGPPRSKLQKLIMGPIEGAAFNGSGTMAPAFFTRDNEGELNEEKYSKQIKADPKRKAVLDAEREGERIALDEWLKLPEDGRKSAYENDNLPLPDALKGKPITPAALTANKTGVRVKLIFNERCARCHKKGEQVEKFPLENVEQIAKYWVPPDKVEIVDGMVRSERQMSIEALTQSTHAHLLSFAMLFSLTGIIFAFTSYPVWFRCIFAPMVVAAQIADVSCWWLARVDGVGPFFAMAIIGTGTLTGIGLLIHIILGTLNMWTGFGRAVMVLLLIGGGAGAVYVGLKVVQPALDVERARAAKKEEPPKADDKAAGQKQAAAPVPAPAAPMAQTSHLEKLIMASRDKNVPFSGDGTMAPAFFEKDKKFKELVAKHPHVEQEREGERLVLQAWLRTPVADRKKSYEADSFPLPLDRTGKPLTPEFLADGKAVKVKSILAARCVTCHGDGGKQDSFPLDTWEGLEAYFNPPK
ncbi:hypothetical protein [Limnoglobus roseus]|uniref:Cytochrome c domain-containing protein n=1 Tax=Limnoglobus roseus TaxID=2598579 RepID=A0A5C1AGJ6_9BACT|nr:hypothetical protein [Limnoglobus roseus]QEL16078.1 hypothetical protein PX52LOC_03017 [Limnoglobus roseus]